MCYHISRGYRGTVARQDLVPGLLAVIGESSAMVAALTMNLEGAGTEEAGATDITLIGPICEPHYINMKFTSRQRAF